jgi:CRISPR-associated protein Cmr6
MANPAVPEYLTRGSDFSDCPPGHRYTLYGSFWEPEQRWERQKNIDPKGLNSTFSRFPDSAVKLRDALLDRQREAARAICHAVLRLEVESVSPFVTGTGIEHPLENGMAFLNPYGLPYLPGSGVKGVLRKAAEELSADVFGEGNQGWDKDAIEALFGRENGDREAEHTRGALSFWDVFPQCEALKIDIMNPHYGDYYQGKTTPHDAGSPKPIFFLTVPAKTGFTFHVQSDPARLPSEWLEDRWKTLLAAAFEHAFTWLGFGAKTAVGYGAMRAPENTRKPETTAVEDTLWENATIAFSVSTREMTAQKDGIKATRQEAKDLFADLGSKSRQEKAKSGKLQGRVKVRKQPDGSWKLLEVLSPDSTQGELQPSLKP